MKPEKNKNWKSEAGSRKTKVISSVFSLLVSVFCLLSFVSAQDFRTIRDGIEYAEMTRGTKDEPVHINLLKLDLTKVRLDVIHALDAAIGLEKTSSIASRHGALAAINGGFFRLDKSVFAGDATGVLRIDGSIWSESNNNRVALGITNGKDKTETNVGRLDTTVMAALILKNGKADADNVVFLSGVNRERKDNELILFTPKFGKTTLADANGLEIIVEKGKIINIVNAKGNSAIPPDGFVVSVGEKVRGRISPKIKIGKKLAFLYAFDEIDEYDQSKLRFWKDAEDIIGGVPQLIKNGKIEITWELEKSSKAFVETRHPRTAVAKLKDGKFLMVTVDGRQTGYSVGMNLEELAAFLLELGATDAMNLDGGGSTTMFLDGKVVNRPSDKEGERAVSDAILVFPRKKN